MPEMITIGGTESPLAQTLQSLNFFLQQKKQKEAEEARKRQAAAAGNLDPMAQMLKMMKMMGMMGTGTPGMAEHQGDMPNQNPGAEPLLGQMMNYF